MNGVRDLGGLLSGVVVNGLLLYGVVALGWSPGSIFLLFPVESIALGIVTFVRLWRRRGTRDESWVGPMPLGTLVFGAIYGAFTLVQLVFVVIVTSAIGVVADGPNLWLPLVLVLARLAVDLWLTSKESLRTVMIVVPPIIRGLTLQIGVILAMGYVTDGSALGLVRHTVAGHVVTTAMMPVVALLVAKTIIEVVVYVGVVVGPWLVDRMFDA
jgi:Family of unknown function (DUF6498)